MLLFLKHARERDFLDRLRGWKDLAREVLAEAGGARVLARMLRYVVLVAGRSLDIVRFRDIVNELTAPRMGELVMTLADKLIRQGMLEGEKRGEKRGERRGREIGRRTEAQAVLTRLLTARFGPLGPDSEERIAAADLPALEAWIDRLLTASCVSEVLSWKPRAKRR